MQAKPSQHHKILIRIAKISHRWFSSISLELSLCWEQEQQHVESGLETFRAVCCRRHGLHQPAVHLQADHGDDGSGSQVGRFIVTLHANLKGLRHERTFSRIVWDSVNTESMTFAAHSAEIGKGFKFCHVI